MSVSSTHASPAELVEIVRQASLAPDETLQLNKIVRFRRRTTRGNPVVFDDFLQALRECKASKVKLTGAITIGIRDDECDLLVETLGSMPCLTTLVVATVQAEFYAIYPISARALSNAIEASSSLVHLSLSHSVVVVGSNADFEQLASVLRESHLQTLDWCCRHRTNELWSIIVPTGICQCFSLRSLKIGDNRAMTTPESAALLVRSLPLLESLDLAPDHSWESMAEVISDNQSIKSLVMRPFGHFFEGVILFLHAMQRNTSVKSLTLHFPDRVDVRDTIHATAELIRHNTTLELIRYETTLDRVVRHSSHGDLVRYSLSDFQFKLRDLNPVLESLAENGRVIFDSAGICAEDSSLFDPMTVENRLNELGRWSLRQRLGDRDAWFRALLSLTEDDDSSPYASVQNTVPCLYSFLRMNPLLFDRSESPVSPAVAP
jgi:hypothetical protein